MAAIPAPAAREAIPIPTPPSTPAAVPSCFKPPNKPPPPLSLIPKASLRNLGASFAKKNKPIVRNTRIKHLAEKLASPICLNPSPNNPPLGVNVFDDKKTSKYKTPILTKISI